MRYCTKCKYHDRAECFYGAQVSMVDGKLVAVAECRVRRQIGRDCGPEAALFVHKNWTRRALSALFA